MTGPIRHMGPRDALMVALIACGFGSSFLFIGIIVAELPPVTLACARSIVSFVTLSVIMSATGYGLPRLGPLWWQLAALGATTQVIPMILVSWGQKSIDSGLAGIILGSVPVVTMVLAHLFIRDERMTVRSIVGALIGFGGVIVVIGGAALSGAGADLGAEIAVFCGATSIAVANIIARRAGQIAPIVLATASQATAVVMLVPLSLMIDQPWTMAPSWSTLAALVVLGTVGSAFPGFIFYRLLVRVGATSASLAAYLVPVVAVVLGALVLDERLAWEVLLGLALILAGARLVNQPIPAPTGGA
jgi:drug/metabolite transporter (DMT)-like permease